MTDIAPEKTNHRAGNLAKARAAKALKRAQEGAGLSIDNDGLAAMQSAQTAEPAPEAAAARTPVRSGRTTVLGRNGEKLTRTRTQSGDIFAIPPGIIPKGWEYQWCAVTVTGNSEILMDQNLMFAENGWRPVPAERHAGRFMPVGHKGSIIRGGQMLMERPAVLCEEARTEDVRLAKQLISDRNESLKLSGVRKGLADGFEMGGKYRGTGGDIRMSIDKALDAPAPKHTLADPGE